MKIEGRLLLFDVENADGSRISSDCKIDIPEKVPIVKDLNTRDPNNCIGSASVSKDEKGLIFTGDIPDNFDTNDYPGCGGYYTDVTYLNTTLVSMQLKCVGLVKKAVNSAYKYKETRMPKVYTSADDCISRKAVLEYIEGSEAELGHSSENELVCQDIKEFPPVTPFRKINKTYKVFCIGGDPKKIAFLANNLRKKIDDLQDSGWEIDGVDLINNTRAWDSGKQMYVETPEYIIRAKKEN